MGAHAADQGRGRRVHLLQGQQLPAGDQQRHRRRACRQRGDPVQPEVADHRAADDRGSPRVAAGQGHRARHRRRRFVRAAPVLGRRDRGRRGLAVISATATQLPIGGNLSVAQAQELVVDQLAKVAGQNPYQFRRAFLKDDRSRAVLDKAAQVGNWGRSMPAGTAQGIAFHAEYKGACAALVEIDCRPATVSRLTCSASPARSTAAA